MYLGRRGELCHHERFVQHRDLHAIWNGMMNSNIQNDLCHVLQNINKISFKLLIKQLTFKDNLSPVLIFFSQANFVVSSGIHSSLHQNFHHQIIFAKLNFKVHYPPPFKREVWHFKKAVNIKMAINGFSWESSFANLDINDKGYLFNKTTKNILSNFIPHETITFDDRDPPWINS